MSGGTAGAFEQAWVAVDEQLGRAADERRTVEVWLRDDDAVDVTPSLERLHALCDDVGMPVLLAVIPAGATAALADWIADRLYFTPCQHGYAHINHAPVGARACELGGRPMETIEAELRAGRDRLRALLGARLSPDLVPPWNRIDPALIPRLPALGFERLSVFGPVEAVQDTMPRLNADLDIVDWRNGRIGRSLDDVARKLAGLIAQARHHGRPIGFLTHHLAHDETAWATLATMLTRLACHPATAFVASSDIR